jgi:glycosyltransferase involved in cell wall biosynthesis
VARARDEEDGTGMSSISVVLPIYNERDNIVLLLDEIDAALGATEHTWEIVAVDDGSTDGSRELLRTLAGERKNLKVVLLRRNYGQTAAFDAGFRNATGDIVVTMDADGQNDPKDIAKLVARLDDGYDVVTGWRKNRQDGFILRRFPSVIANWMIRKITGAEIHDLGCSLKVYRRAITDEMRLYGEMHRFISVIAEHHGARVGELVVNHRARVHGVSKYGIIRTFKVLLDLLTVWFLRRYQTKPIYFFGGIGFLLAIASGVLAAVVLWEKYEDGVWVHRNPLFILAMICLLVSVQLVATGLLAEILIRTYFESQNRTAYAIAARIGFDA